jgi:hypothetical protein
LAEIGVPTHLIAIELVPSGLRDSISPATVRRYLPSDYKQFYPEDHKDSNGRGEQAKRNIPAHR